MTKTPTSMKTHLRRTAIFAGISLAIGSAPPLLAQDDDAVEQIVVRVPLFGTVPSPAPAQ